MNTEKKLEAALKALHRAEVVLDMLSEVEPAELDLAQGIARREAAMVARAIKDCAL